MVVLLTLVLSACGEQITTQTSAPVASSEIPSPTAIPSPAFTPTQFAPVQIGTPLPESLLVPITIDNVAKILEVGVYGAYKEAKLLTPDGKYMLIGGVGGGYVIETESQKLIVKLKYQTLLDVNQDATLFLVKNIDSFAVLTIGGETIELPLIDGFKAYTGALLPDNKAVAIIGEITDAYNTSLIKIISLETREVINSLPADSKNQSELGVYEARVIKFSTEGKYVNVINGYVNFIFNVASGSKALSLEGWNVEISPDEKLAAVVRNNGQLEIWDIEAAKAIRRINLAMETGKYQLFPLMFSQNSQYIAMIDGLSGGLKVWNIKDGTLVASNEDKSIKNFDLTRIENNGDVKAYSALNQIPPWGIEDYRSLGSGISVHLDKIAFNPDGTEIHTQYAWNGAEICSIALQAATNCNEFPYSANRDDIKYQDVVIGSDGQFYSVLRNENEYTIQSGISGTGEILGKIMAEGNSPLQVHLFIPNTPIALYSSGNELRITDFTQNKVIGYGSGELRQGSFYSIAQSQNYLALLASPNISIIDTKSLDTKTVITPIFDETKFESTPFFALSPDGRKIAMITALLDSPGFYEITLSQLKLTVLDTANGKQIYSQDMPIEKRRLQHLNVDFRKLDNLTFRPFPDSFDVFALEFSPNGDFLVLSYNGNLYFINSKDGAVSHVIPEPPAYDIAFSPNGKMLALNEYLGGVHLFGVQP